MRCPGSAPGLDLLRAELVQDLRQSRTKWMAGSFLRTRSMGGTISQELSGTLGIGSVQADDAQSSLTPPVLNWLFKWLPGLLAPYTPKLAAKRPIIPPIDSGVNPCFSLLPKRMMVWSYGGKPYRDGRRVVPAEPAESLGASASLPSAGLSPGGLERGL